jgi:hypothetical protein
MLPGSYGVASVCIPETYFFTARERGYARETQGCYNVSDAFNQFVKYIY